MQDSQKKKLSEQNHNSALPLTQQAFPVLLHINKLSHKQQQTDS